MKKNKIGLTQYIKQYSDVLLLRYMDIVYVDCGHIDKGKFVVNVDSFIGQFLHTEGEEGWG